MEHGKTTLSSSELITFQNTPKLYPPEFIRLPKPGQQCPYTGLSRSHLNSLILPTKANGNCPPVRSVSLRQRGATRGVRLVVFESILSYLNKQECNNDNLAAMGGENQ